MNEVDVRPAELRQHLPGLGRQALHVLAISLGVQGVEDQRGFPGAARPRDHHQLSAGQTKLEILQVVLPGTLDVNVCSRLHDAITSRFRPARQSGNHRDRQGCWNSTRWMAARCRHQIPTPSFVLVLAVAGESPLHTASFELYPGSKLNPNLPNLPTRRFSLSIP